LSSSNCKIAWLSPFPPQRSGIANYSYCLVKTLRPHLDIDLYYDHQPPSAELQSQNNAYPVSEFAARFESYDEVIYHLGNNSDFHREIYKLAWNFPGTVVLHDYNLRHFMRESFYRQADEQLYKWALADGDDEEGNKGLQRLIHKLIPATVTSPMSHSVVNRSKKAIVHHRWVRDQFADQSHIEVIPHFAKINDPPTSEQIQKFKNKFAIKQDHFVLSCLGFINTNKLPNLQIEVVKRLLDDGYPVQMVFAGEPAPEVKALEAEIRSGRYRDEIIFTGYLEEREYFSAIFASDIVVNLRNPSMGEASGTLMHALAAAKPTIISDINQYREFPDKVCWKVVHDGNQAEVLYAYLSILLADRDLRMAISRNSSEYVKNLLNLDKVAARWLQVILK
jgi:glycosyltransferase involved in cell wall biosynthesis